MSNLTHEELQARYNLVCRASHADSDTSPVQNELADELAKLKKIITHELPELARQRSPHNFTELHQNLLLEMERFHEFCEFPHLAQKVVVGLGGAFSAGKSSLINALLGKKRLATEVDPTTSLPTYLLQGETEAITALNLFKRRVDLLQEEFLSLTHDEKERYGSQVSALLQSAFISLPDFPFENLALLDTPGYSKPDDANWSDRTDANLARAQLNSAQFIIWVVSAEAGVISENDLKFLASLRQDIPRLVVISRADKRTPEDVKNIVQVTRNALEQNNLPTINVLPFSSRKKKDYPAEPIFRHLKKWNEQRLQLGFIENFEAQFVSYKSFIDKEKEQSRRYLDRVNRILSLSDDSSIDSDALDIRKTAKDQLDKLQEISKCLNGLDNDFFEILNKVGKYQGINLDRSNAFILKADSSFDGSSTQPSPFDLGLAYYQGDGVTQSYEEAAHWFQLAAFEEHASSQFALGVMYANGQGVEQDQSEAVIWYYRAAEQGHAKAQYNLGVIYANGRGVEKNQIEAMHWYRKAAQQGNIDAQYNIGTNYLKGIGVDQDIAQAKHWLIQAAAQGHKNSQFNLGVIYELSEHNNSEARRWYRKAMEQGHDEAKERLRGL